MKPTQAIQRAGGRQKDLIRVFDQIGFPCSKQAVSRWVKIGVLPPKRILQLQRRRPSWFSSRKA
jgi:hypothetical protein